MPEDEKEIPAWFSIQVAALFELYPGVRATQATIPAWWNHQHDIDPRRIQEALHKCPAASAQFIPTAQTVREIALALPSSRPQERGATPLTALPEPCALSPSNPFLNLTQRWEYESLELGLDPDRPPPNHLAARRLQELDAMLSSHGPQDIPGAFNARVRRHGVAA